MSGGNLIKPPVCFQPQKKSNGAPNGFYGEIDWDRYVSKTWTWITITIQNNVVSAEAKSLLLRISLGGKSGVLLC